MKSYSEGGHLMWLTPPKWQHIKVLLPWWDSPSWFIFILNCPQGIFDRLCLLNVWTWLKKNNNKGLMNPPLPHPPALRTGTAGAPMPTVRPLFLTAVPMVPWHDSGPGLPLAGWIASQGSGVMSVASLPWRCRVVFPLGLHTDQSSWISWQLPLIFLFD